MALTNKKLWIAITVLVWLVSLGTRGDRCERAWFAWGLDLGRCPDGAVRQTARLSASGLRRGAAGQVTLAAIAHYTTGDADGEQRAPVPRARSIELSLVGKGAATRGSSTGPSSTGPAAGQPPAPSTAQLPGSSTGQRTGPTPGQAPGSTAGQAPGGAPSQLSVRPLAGVRWHESDDTSWAEVSLPEVPDGDYQLRARYTTALGTGEVSLPLALYAPARIHVLTDRPLYEPGNTVRFRAVVLRAHDLAPLDHRPGTWVVTSPENEVLLEEAAPAGAWGVVSGSFPLDRRAPTGTWKVAWRSADAVDEVPFTVEPFTLPRFRVDAIAGQPFYRAGDRPVIRGAVRYASGAPVAAAQLDITWDIAGDWPPPLAWQTTLLPRHAQTAASGRFELALPEVPADLQGRATLTARISAVDAAGDRVAGAATVLLSQDGIQVAAVTELADGLVESFNNRLYVRVATPDGRVVANTKVTLRRAWQPNDPGITAELDEDGVASVQLDPGAPVNLVIPAAPWRPAPPRALVTRGATTELIGGEGASLADQVALDRWLPRLASCAAWLDEDAGSTRLALRVAASGAVLAAGAGPAPIDRCVVGIARQQRLPAGRERLYTVELQLADPALPRLTASVEGALEAPPGLDDEIEALVGRTRDCLPSREGSLARMLTWRVAAGKKAVELTGWIADPTATEGEGEAAMACVTARFAGARIVLAEPAASDALGLVRFSIELPASERQARPQPTTMLGYELLVTAQTEGAPTAKLRIAPGAVPPLRLRVTPVLPRPGEPVTAELVRGPAWTGALPEKLALTCLRARAEGALDKEHRVALVVPNGVEGWCAITAAPSATGEIPAGAAGVRALIYVRPAAELRVSVVPGRDRYKPGERAELAIRTTLGGKGGPAAVGLFGVDDSLGQLVPLPDGDALGRLRPQVETRAPAFGVLDGQALTLGRIRGANAAAATVLRVAAIPAPPELDAVASGQAQSAFDPIEELTDRFYLVLAELHGQVRAWEAKAPAGEKMTPATLARLWAAALDACAARGQRVDDAYGRRLRLSRLPADLLALTDPRAVVVVATRLTEDVENWAAWVRREQP